MQKPSDPGSVHRKLVFGAAPLHDVHIGVGDADELESIANNAAESYAEVLEAWNDGASYFDGHVFGTFSRQLHAAPLKEPRLESIEVIE